MKLWFFFIPCFAVYYSTHLFAMFWNLWKNEYQSTELKEQYQGKKLKIWPLSELLFCYFNILLKCTVFSSFRSIVYLGSWIATWSSGFFKKRDSVSRFLLPIFPRNQTIRLAWLTSWSCFEYGFDFAKISNSKVLCFAQRALSEEWKM